jgi:hypothetical protein
VELVVRIGWGFALTVEDADKAAHGVGIGPAARSTGANTVARALVLGLALAAATLAVLPLSTASADSCPNAAFRTGPAAHLPDCRAYEQVTPTNKNGVDASGGPAIVRASSLGDRVSFFASAGIPVGPGSGSGDFPTYVSSRDPAGWTTNGVLPPSQPGTQPVVLGYSPDLSQTLLNAQVVGDANTNNLYLRDNATGSLQRLLTGGFDYFVVDFSADRSHLFFESDAQLLPSAAAGVFNLYELNHGSLSLAGVLPDGSTPPGGSFAGSYSWQLGDTARGGANQGLYTQTAMSADGSSIFFTAGGTAQLYLRKSATTTVQISASQRTIPDPNGPLPAAFMTAAPDASHVFFTSCQKLTNDSTAVSTATPSCTEPVQGQDLYRYDASSGTLTDLTIDATPGDALGAAVQGVVGSSADGSYVYFVANGVLAAGASPGSCQGTQAIGACNLYLWHNGTVSFIAPLANTTGDPRDAYNWTPSESVPGAILAEQKDSRVSSDGKTMVFRSKTQLAGYDNQGFAEFYRYDAAVGRFACISCNPSGAPPTGNATIQDIRPFVVGPSTHGAVLTRNLSADGSRFFFESPDALVASDTNATQDVYEWEAMGVGSCTNSGGCLYLLSGGTSADRSYFADASASGDHVFLFTRQALVGQDQDELVDIYDASVGGGIAAQTLTPSAPCSGDSCKPQPSTAPPGQSAGSESFSGPGNPIPPLASTPPTKPKTAAELKAEKLTKALKACKKDKPRAKRTKCEKTARKKFGPAKKAKKASNKRRARS